MRRLVLPFPLLGLLVAVFAAIFFFIGRRGGAVVQWQVFFPDEITPKVSGFPAVGDSSARMHMIFYTGYECPFSREMDRSIDSIAAVLQSRVFIVYKVRPLYHDKPRRCKAKAAYAAHRQGAFDAMHRRLTAMAPLRKGNADYDSIEALCMQHAKELGLDEKAFLRDLRGKALDALLDSVVSESRHWGVRAYPAAFVNGILVEGAVGAARLRELGEITVGRRK